MIIIDANLLIYATYRESPQHQRANTWFKEQVDSGIRIGLPWISLLAFLRITTNPRVFERPLTVHQATEHVNEWLALSSVWTPAATERHAKLLRQFLMDVGAGGNLVPDAHLATLSVEHGLILCSTDRDFSQFSGLRWYNPLQSKE